MEKTIYSQALADASRVPAFSISDSLKVVAMRAIVTLVVIFSLSANAALPINNIDLNAQGQASDQEQAQAQQLAQDIQIPKQNVELTDFLQSLQKLSPNLSLPVDPHAPDLDKDPFFLASQAWEKGMPLDQTEDLTAEYLDAGIRLHIPGGSKVLHLQLPLEFVQLTDDFIFFSLKAGSKLFNQAVLPSEDAGQGLFVISRSELFEHSGTRQAVPIYFFPLPGLGWQGRLQSIVSPHLKILSIASQQGIALPIDLEDVQKLVDVERINLQLATAFTVQSEKLAVGAGDSANSKTVLPAPGTTQAFGLFFTGINLRHPEASLPQSVAIQDSAVQRAWGKLSTLALGAKILNQPSQAFVLSAVLIAQIVFVTRILLGGLVVSIILKYSNPYVQSKLKENRAAREKGGEKPIVREPPAATRGARLKQTFSYYGRKSWRETREILDVYAQTLTTIANFAPISFANGLEILLDYFAPAVTAGDHTLVRKWLKNSFYFVRDSSKRSPADYNTFIKGAVVFGAIDTTSVVLQYLVVTPWLCATAAPYLSTSLQERILKSFDPNNPNLMKITANDAIRDELSYLQNGASSMALDRRSQVIEQVSKDVNAELIRRGRNPFDPSVQALKERLKEQKITLLMQQQGLNGNFMFDSNTLWEQLPNLLGYRTQGGVEAGQTYILAKRSMLATHAINIGLSTLQKRAASGGNAVQERQAVEIFQYLKSNLSLLSVAASAPGHGVQYARERWAESMKVRHMLTLLSYEGPIDWIVQNVPQEWEQKWSPEAAQVASLVFRQSLFSLLSAEGSDLLTPNPEAMEKYAGQARKKAIDLVVLNHKEELQRLPQMVAAQLVKSKYAYEIKVRTELEVGNIMRLVALQEAAGKHQVKRGWYQRRLEEAAWSWADERASAWLSSEQGDGHTVTEDALNLQRRRLFTQAMAKKVGLQLGSVASFDPENEARYEKMIAHVEDSAESDLQADLTNDLNIKTYYSKLDPAEKLKLEASLYATHFLDAYRESSTEIEMVSPLSPNAPGTFQKLRQWTPIRKSKFLTRVVRVFESLGDDQALSPTLYAKASRLIPLFDDMVSSHRRFLKSVWSSLTVSYIWNYYFWGIHLPYGAWVVMLLSVASTIRAPSQWLTRAFRMNESPIMGGWVSSITHNLAYAWVTFLGIIPVVMYNADVTMAFNEYIRDPIMGAMAVVPHAVWIASAMAAGIGLAKAAPGGWKGSLERLRAGISAIPGFGMLATDAGARAAQAYLSSRNNQCQNIFVDSLVPAH